VRVHPSEPRCDLPAGTGKTTVARLVGEMFHELKLLGSPKVHSCSVTDLVGIYLGQTGPKTREAFTKVRQAGCEWQLAFVPCLDDD
jgi:SpoVK/Ycf46/Vps4 family AAA+-type ATPase